MPQTPTRRRDKGRGGPRRVPASPATPPPEPRPGRAAWARSLIESGATFPVLVVVLHLVLALLAFNPAPYTGGDNGAYVALARSLIERHRYLELWDPSLRPHAQFPPVFPVMLAVAMLAGIKPWVGIKLMMVAISAASVGCATLWLRRATTPVAAAVVAVALAIAPGVVDQSHWELSDLPAWGFTMLALWASTHVAPTPRSLEDASVEGAGDDADDAPADPRWAAVLVAALVLANFTRAAGLPLVVAAALWLALRGRWRVLAALLAVYVPLQAAWMLRARSLEGGGYTGAFWYVNPYQPELGRAGAADMLRRISSNINRYVAQHIPAVLTGGIVLGAPIGAAVVVPAAGGWGQRVSRRCGLAEVWAPMYLAVLLLWPAVWAGERFLLPLLPVLLRYTAEVVRDVAAALGPRAAPVLAGAAAALLIAAAVPDTLAQARDGMECTQRYAEGDAYACVPRGFAEFYRIAAASRTGLPPGAVVVSRKPTLFYALSGHRGIIFPLSAEPDSFFRAAQRVGARYVVLDKTEELSPRYLYPVLRARADAFCVESALTSGRSAMLRFDPAAALAVRPAAPAGRFATCATAAAAAPPAR